MSKFVRQARIRLFAACLVELEQGHPAGQACDDLEWEISTGTNTVWLS